MLSDRDIERLAGALLVTSFMLFLGHVVTLLTMGAGLTTIVVVLLYGFPVSLSGLALYRTFHTHEPTLASFSAFGFAAHGLFVVLTAALLLAGLRYPQEFATFGAETSSVTGAASVLELSMDKIRTLAFVFLGLGLLPLGVLIARTGAVARWVGWLGVVAGALLFFGLLAWLSGLLVGRPAGMLRQIGVLSAFGFILILGVRLLLRETQEGVGSSRSATSRFTRVGILAAVGVGLLNSCAPADSREANKALVRGYLEGILNEGDVAAVDDYFPEEGFTFNGRLLTRQDLPRMRQALLSRFSDFHLTIEDQIAEGDRVVTRVTFRGTHSGEFGGIAATGRQVEYAGIAIDRIVDGKVVEGWHVADELGMLRQLGVEVGR